MNNSKKTNPLPKGWTWVTLGEISLKVESVKRKEQQSTEVFLYLDIGGIDNVSNKISNCKKINWENAPSRAQQIVLKDDILFSTVRTYMRNIAIVDNPIYNGQIASSGFCVIRADKTVAEPKFIFYYTISEVFLRPLNELQTGSSYPAVRDKDVLTQPFPLPPKPIQQAIVSKIEELFSELDKGIEQLKVAQQQLKTYRQAVLKWAFEGRFTNENVKDGELPVGWKKVSVTKLVGEDKHALKAGPFGSSLKKDFYSKSGYKIYGQEQVINNDPFYGDYFIDENKYQELINCKVRPDDILISLVGTIGKVLILPKNCTPGIINPRLIKISLNTEIYLPQFFKYYFESSFVKSFYSTETSGTTMDVLNLGIIKTIPFPLCTVDEQLRIIQEIKKRISLVERLEDDINKNLQKAKSLQTSILKKAFEGKLILN